MPAHVGRPPTNRQWISFSGPIQRKGHMTREWRVLSIGGATIGHVRWYTPWRCHSFFPESESLFESSCLLKLAQFCAQKTREQRATWSRNRVPVTP